MESTLLEKVSLTSNALSPLLVQLQQSLQAAMNNDPNHYLPVNATTIGNAGAAIITLMQSALGINNYILTANISITPDEGADTLTVTGDTAATIINIDSPTLTAVFSVQQQTLTIELSIPAQDPWEFTDTFPAFNNTWLSQLSFVNNETTWPVFILSSIQRNVSNGQLAAGLNLSAQVDLQAPFNTLLTLIPGAANPLPVLGPVTVSDPVTTSLNLLGTVPAFTLQLPGMQPLVFNHPSFSINGLSTVYNGIDYLRMDCYVMADITLNTYTLPLAARLPIGGTFPQLLLPPKQSVPLSVITGFFSSLFTSNISSLLTAALPEPLSTLLGKFSLNGFVITLLPGWKGFSNISFAIASTNPPNTPLWPLIPGVFELKEVGIALQLKTVAGNNPYSITGSVWGSVNVGQQLVIGSIIPLPIDASEWIFTASADNAIPSLGQFAQFLGGDKLGGLLPANLKDIGGFSMTNLTVTWRPTDQTFTTFGLTLATNNTWTIIPNWFLVKQLDLQMQVANPLTTPQLTGTFSGTLVIGSIGVAVSIDRADPNSSWILSVITETITLPSLGDMTQLLGGTQLVNVLPDSIVQNHFQLDDLTVNIDISQQKLNLLSFILDSTDNWDIITGLLSINKPGVVFQFDWSHSKSPVITGRIYGDLIFAGADFYVTADKNTDGWDLGASLQNNTTLHLFDAADAVITGASQQLTTLGVPNVVLSTANISYHTKDGSYELEGVVNINNSSNNLPWSFNVGQTGISIKDLGIKVTSQAGTNNAPKNTKVYIKGTLNIGSTISFDILYEVGGDLVVKGTLVGTGQYISVKDLVSYLCDPSADTVTWTSAFESLDQIQFTNVQLNFLIGKNPSFQVYGTMLISSVEVDAVFVLTKQQNIWNFALGIKVSMSPKWSIPGFTDTLSTFQLEQVTFALVASSFANAYTLPAAIGITEVSSVSRGLNFYAQFQISSSDARFKAARAVLPNGMLPTGTTITIQGLITDPLKNSYVEVVLNSDPNGVPLMGWDSVLLTKFSLRLYASPAIALHGEFIMTMITDDKGNPLSLSLDLKASPTEISIVFIPDMPWKDRKVIIAWANALGITGLTFYLTDLELGIEPFAGPALVGTVGGGIDFTSTKHVGAVFAPNAIVQPNTILAGCLPDPVIVAELKKQRALLPSLKDAFCDMSAAVDLNQAIDSNIRVEAKVGFLVIPESPEPVVPNQIGLRAVNFTLPYILKRFADITLPDILFPVLFPDICFYVNFDPTQLTKVLDFEFNGKIVVFGFNGQIAATCNQDRIYFHAGMDPVIFSIYNQNLLVLQRSATDSTHGPYVTIDSAATGNNPNIAADLYCNFFDTIQLAVTALVKVDKGNIANSYFYFDLAGNAGQLTNMNVHCEYLQAKYMNISCKFELFLDTSNIPGFDITNPSTGKDVKAADQIDLAKIPGQSKIPGQGGVDLLGKFAMILDNRGNQPSYTLTGCGSFEVKVGSCDIQLHLQFGVDQVTADTISDLPSTIVQQMKKNAKSIFSALYQSADCFAKLVNLGVIIFDAAVEVAKVLVGYFETDINVFCQLLDQLNNTVQNIADWLWNIFGSNNSGANTKALRANTKFGDNAISQAVKASVGDSYTAEMLISDQAFAGYSATSAANALVYNFSNYANDAVGAGKLLSAKYSFQEVVPALHTVFPSQTATAEDMCSILVQIFGTTLTAQQMADALALIYPAKQVAQALKTHYATDTDTAAKMSVLLLTAYQLAKNPLSVSDLAGALAPLYSPADVAPVLKNNFPDKTATVTDMAALLNATYNPPLKAAQMADALAASPYAVLDVAKYLKSQSSYATDVDTATKMANILYTAYQSSISATDMLQTLAAVNFNAYESATPIKNLYTSITTNALATDLVNGYQTIAPLNMLLLGIALSAAGVNQNDLVVAVNNALPTTTAGEMAAMLVIAYSSNTSAGLSTAESNKIAGKDVFTTSPLVVSSVSGILATELTGALVSVFTPPNTAITDLSKALCKGYSNPVANDVASGIMSAFNDTSSTDLANALTTGYSAIGQTLTANEMSNAIVAGFTFIGKAITETEVLQFLLAHYSGITPLQGAQFLVSSFGSHTSIEKVLAALYTCFSTLTPIQATIALQETFPVSNEQVINIARPVVQTFSLTQLPNDVGCISLALKAAQYQLSNVSSALSKIYNSNWHTSYYSVVLDVYSNLQWDTLLQGVEAGQTAPVLAQSLKNTYPSLQPAEMCSLLVAGFYLIQVNTSVVPMATAMKAAGYSITQTAGAMSKQYAPNWTTEDYGQVVQVYNS
ncbi:hypothetical protein [Chitinophaga flava]|uniref:Uncharacterized protein n=1 Tax=Chitinophaga flava TaxID=2259036 RepID=A0A365XY70_9BACT|nr:hypothetical protein [Chitinophaga flava]RBL90525.1 hypothetical protein DF182_29145 [Chitinophaga flava]